MIREASSNYQISPNITRKIRQEIGRLNTTTPSGSKPLKLLTFATAHAILIALLLSIGSHANVEFPEPFGLTSQSEMNEGITPPTAQNTEKNEDTQNQLGKRSDEDGNDEVTIKGRIPSVSALAYSPNGKTIAVASNDGTTYLYGISRFGLEKFSIYPVSILSVRNLAKMFVPL